MENTIIFIAISVLIGFIGSFYLNKVNQWIQLIVAIGAGIFFLVLYFTERQNGSLIMVLLSASWIVKITKAAKGHTGLKKND